jgi:hypothetical protein
MRRSSTGGKPLRLAAIVVAGCLTLTACTSKGARDADPVTYSTLGVPGEMLCGFVPKTDLITALGSRSLTTKGTLHGRGGSSPLTDSGCSVYADRRDIPNFDVEVWDRAHDNGFTEWELKNPKPAFKLFPADHPVGFAEAKYGSRLDGTKIGDYRTGAVAVAIIGDWYINLRIYRPGKGRNAITDAINLIHRVAASLQLPTQATRTYTPFVPSTPNPRPPSPPATPPS